MAKGLKRSRYFGSPKKKIGRTSNYSWLAYNASPWKITPGYGNLGPSKETVTAANKILSLGSRVNKIPKSEVNAMLGFLTNSKNQSKIANPGYTAKMKKYYYNKYFLSKDLQSSNRITRSRAKDYVKKLGKSGSTGYTPSIPIGSL